MPMWIRISALEHLGVPVAGARRCLVAVYIPRGRSALSVLLSRAMREPPVADRAMVQSPTFFALCPPTIKITVRTSRVRGVCRRKANKNEKVFNECFAIIPDGFVCDLVHCVQR